MSSLKNKNIIVTGASGGIGNSIVEKLYENDANILATGTRTEKLEERLHYLQELIGLDPENSIELNIKKSLNIEPYNIEGTKDSEYSNSNSGKYI